MFLRASWVDEIWGRLTLAYGVAFQRQYTDLDQAAVKRDWADVLGVFDAHPKCIAQALTSLPDKPPNALQFKALGISALAEQRQEVPALPAPVVDKAVVNAVLAAVRRPSNRLDRSEEQCVANIVRIHGPAPRNLAVRAMLASCQSIDQHRSAVEVT